MSALSSAPCPPCTLASLLRGKWKWKWYCSLWQEALLTLCTNGKVSQSFEFVYNAEFVVGMFTAPNGQTQESTKTHFESKSRKSEKRMARKTECRTEYSTQYIQKYHIYMYMDTYVHLYCSQVMWKFEIFFVLCMTTFGCHLNMLYPCLLCLSSA